VFWLPASSEFWSHRETCGDASNFSPGDWRMTPMGTIWIISLGTAIAIGAGRGRLSEGIALGILLGPLGAVIVALLPRCAANEARRRLQVDAEMQRLAAQRRKTADRPSLARRLGRKLAERPASLAAPPLPKTCPICGSPISDSSDVPPLARDTFCPNCGELLRAGESR
jgi:hypothetical protein